MCHADDPPYKERHPGDPAFHEDGAMWPGENLFPGEESPDEPPRTNYPRSAAHWPPPPPPVFPGLPVRRISTPARLNGPPGHTILGNQPISALGAAGGGYLPASRPTEASPTTLGSTVAAFTRFSAILDLQQSNIELGQRLLGDVSWPHYLPSWDMEPCLLHSSPLSLGLMSDTQRRRRTPSNCRSHLTHQRCNAHRSGSQVAGDPVGTHTPPEGLQTKRLVT